MIAAAAALVSCALIAFQVALMQALSIAQWYHFAGLVISVALLGFGAAGSVLAAFRQPLLSRADGMIAAGLLACGVSMALGLPLAQTAAARFDLYLLFVERGQAARLALTCAIFFAPFFFGALALAVIFTSRIGQIGRLYGANLLGSALGGVAALAGLHWFAPTALPATLGLLPLAGAILAAPANHRGFFGVAGLAGAAICLLVVARPPPLTASAYKGLSRALNLPGAKVVFERRHPLGHVHVVTATALRYAPGLSLAWQDEVPRSALLFINGNGHAAIPPPKDTGRLFDYTTAALPFVLRRPGSVLVLHAGGGTEVVLARRHGAEHVLVVEPHPVVAELARTGYAGLGVPLNANLVVEDPRAFLGRSRERYDLALLPPVGEFGGAAGLHAMQEQYLLTREAFARIWGALADNGALSVTAWMDYPPRHAPRLLALLVAMLTEAGVADPAAHIAAVRSWSTLTFAVTRQALTAEDIEAVQTFCQERQFDLALLPGATPEERTRHHKMQDATLTTLLDGLLSTGRADLVDCYDFRLAAPTDDQPFFSQFLRGRNLAALRKLYGEASLPFVELGSLVLALTFVLVALPGATLILLPLLKLGAPGFRAARPLLYFAGLGLGFMLLEIALIQRFILFWGHPLYAAASVIGTLLTGMGLGSLYSSRLDDLAAARRIILVVVLGFLLALPWLAPVLTRTALAWPFPWRIGATVLLLLPPAFLLGMPMPLGLRAIRKINSAWVPWAWGINGCFSVAGAVLAAWLAVVFGFSTVLAAAAISYTVALLAVPVLPR